MSASKIGIPEASVDPNAVAGEVQIYGKPVSGTTELFARASDGTISQITPAGGGGGGGGTSFTHVEDIQTGSLPLNNNDTTRVLSTAAISRPADSWVQIIGSVYIKLLNNNNADNVFPQVVLLRDDGDTELARWSTTPGELVGDGDYNFHIAIPIIWTEQGDDSTFNYVVDIITDTTSGGTWSVENRSLSVNVIGPAPGEEDEGGTNFDRNMLPTEWRATDIPTSNPNAPMTTGVANTNEFRAMRAGSIVGLSTVTEPGGPGVTGGNLTVRVAINEIPGTLAVSHDSGTFPEGGYATQTQGIDTYVAGDLISVIYSTDGAFTPNGTLDIAAWLQIEEIGISSGGGGGGSLPVVGPMTTNFTAEPNKFYTLGTPGGKGFAVASLPDPAASSGAAIAFKLMVDSQGWQINAAPFGDMDGWSDLPGPRKQYAVFWVKSNGTSWMITGTYEVLTHPQDEQFYPANGTVVADPNIPITYFGTQQTGNLIIELGRPDKGIGTMKTFLGVDPTGDQTDTVTITPTVSFLEVGLNYEFNPASPGAGEATLPPKLVLMFTALSGNEAWMVISNNRFKGV